MGDAAERIAAALEGLLEIERERRAEERLRMARIRDATLAARQARV